MSLRTACVALITVALISAACGDDNTNNGYSADIRNAYMEGCTGSQSEAFCACTLNELEDRYTQEEFFRFAIEASDEPPQDLIEISLDCIGEADIGG